MRFLPLLWAGLGRLCATLSQSFVSWLSFSSEIDSLVDAVNHRLDEPPARIGQRLDSHPGGIARILGKRRLNMASAYIKIAHDHAPTDVQERLAALKMLMEEALHAKTINMPLNTARVQISLIKDVVKSRRCRRKQMEAISDFGLASFGHEAVIRGFLAQQKLIEVPELGLPLRSLEMGWDDHVHDFLSEGRKTPTQVLLDAFVKGLSRVTLVHSTVEEPQLIHEAISAGNLLGIEVRIGIEFSVGPRNHRRHYMFVPPPVETSRDFFAFFADHHQDLGDFIKGLQANAEHRRQTMVSALTRFNTVTRPKINSGYPAGHPGYLEALTWTELQALVTCDQVNRVHLAELLWQKMRRAFHARVLELKAQVLTAEERFRSGLYSEWEMRNVAAHYHRVRQTYVEMSPEQMLAQYLDTRDVLDYDSAFTDERPLLERLLAHGGQVLWVHPLEMGIRAAIVHLIRHCDCITQVEAINLRDSANRNPDDITLFARFLELFNNRPTRELALFLDQAGIGGFTPTDLDRRRETMRQVIVPVCGSDSTGRDPAIPGMGFIRSSQIPESIRESYLAHHYRVARPVAELILAGGRDPAILDGPKGDHDIVCMGKIGQPIRNLVGDENLDEQIDLVRFLKYLNPTVKNVLRVGIGFAASFAFMSHQYGWLLGGGFAFLWFFVTGTRNYLVDMIASSGSDLKSWAIKNVNADNIAQSLFWTGFSVPILGLVKMKFDAWWPWDPQTASFETAKFLFICLANGLYITGHNKLRNFDRRVIRANFFRTVLAWPFATLTSPLGNALGIPSIVQAKIWSDIVGGMIEGSGKFKQRYVLRQRDLMEVLPRLRSEDRDIRLTAMLDILFIWGVQPRGKTCLAALLLQERSWSERLRDWWYARETSDAIHTVQELYRQYFQRLDELFMDPGALANLTRFVLLRFSDSDAVHLTGLIGEQLEPFRSWLRWIRGRFESKRPEPVDVSARVPPAVRSLEPPPGVPGTLAATDPAATTPMRVAASASGAATAAPAPGVSLRPVTTPAAEAASASVGAPPDPTVATARPDGTAAGPRPRE